jgi:flagellar protein FliO/FliZ
MRAATAIALGAALAPLAGAATAALPAAEPLGAVSVLQLGLSLAAVVAAIFGLGWILRRMHALPGSTHRALKVIATLPVGARERIAIIQAGDEQVLVGLAPGRIQTLHVLERPVPEAAPHGRAFSALLERESARCDS